jgi:hypothetical protein
MNQIGRFNWARTMLELFKRNWSLRKESICVQVFDKLKEVLDAFPDSPAVLYDWAISGFFYAYGFSRTNAAAKDTIGQQARNALTKAIKHTPALMTKIHGMLKEAKFLAVVDGFTFSEHGLVDVDVIQSIRSTYAAQS